MGSRVAVEVEEAVAHVRMTRGEKRNGLDRAMFDELIAAGEHLAEQRGVRAVVLSGEGPAFCAGLDFPALMMGGQEAIDHLLHREEGKPGNVAQRVAMVWHLLPVPVIAAIQGPAFGGGLQIALGCDMRFARPDAELSVMELRMGLIPDMGITQTLLPLVGADVAKMLTYTAMRVSGEEALKLGLVTRVCEDPLAEALEMARVIAGKNPHAIRAAKTLLNEAPGLDMQAGLWRETELQLPILGSANQMAAVQAAFAKQTPVFED